MKRNALLFIATFMAIVLFSSCDTGESGSDSNSNYWYSNSLTRMNLKGTVKSISDEWNAFYTFNLDGNMTSKYDLIYGDSTVYHYENGLLVSQSTISRQFMHDEQRMINRQSGIYGQSTQTMTFAYENAGKFVPAHPFHLHEDGLIPGLSSMESNSFKTDYVFDGNMLNMISYEKNGEEWIPSDTAIITYSGAYPASYVGQWDFFEGISMQSNGMFSTYTEGFNGPYSRTTRERHFVSINGVQRVSSCSETMMQADTIYSQSSISYTYNQQGDLVSEIYSDGYQQAYSDYVYDAHGNWISRNYSYKNGEQWTAPVAQTRTITYY